MIHKEILEQIKKDRQENDFIYPDYGRFSIAELVPTILQRFGVNTDRKTFPPEFLREKKSSKEKIVLFMVDGLGLNQVEYGAKKDSFYKTLVEKGEIYPITSVFPSTTPAALTTIHTGLTPQEHGLPEWKIYLEEIDRMVETLPFRQEHHHERDSLDRVGGKPEMLYDGDTVYQKLQQAGIKTYSFVHHDYAQGAYSRMVNKGSNTIMFSSGTDLMHKLSEEVKKEAGPAYFMVYWSEIDSVQHHYGPGSKEHFRVLDDFSNLLNVFIEKMSSHKNEDLLILLTADHGQVNIKDEQIIYLNSYLLLENSYDKSAHGTKILPSGAPRDVFLFINSNEVAKQQKFLQEELKSRAEVISTKDALEKGMFGFNEPAQKFIRRIGNTLILPHENYYVWYKYAPDSVWKQLGIHGGLSEKEMIVPFAVAHLKDLIP